MTPNNTSRHAIGFANQYYTLWIITSSRKDGFTRTRCTYLQNLSTELEKAKAKFEEKFNTTAPEPDMELRGLSRSFSVVVPDPDVFPKGKYQFQKISECDDLDYIAWCYNNMFNKDRKQLCIDRLLDNGYELNDSDFLSKVVEKTEEDVLLENCEKGLKYDSKAKVELQVTVCNVFGFDGHFGWTTVCQMVDENNVLVKYVGGACPEELKQVGAKIKVRGTVKHDSYRKEVQLQRIKVLN